MFATVEVSLSDFDLDEMLSSMSKTRGILLQRAEVITMTILEQSMCITLWTNLSKH